MSVQLGKPPSTVRIATLGLPVVTGVGDTVRLICSSDGDLPLNFKWYAASSTMGWELAHGSKYRIRAKGRISTLRIESFQHWDAGYVCEVKNAFGNARNIHRIPVAYDPKNHGKISCHLRRRSLLFCLNLI